jgi:glycosyltransferase involved in cell wall biosynthesis
MTAVTPSASAHIEPNSPQAVSSPEWLVVDIRTADSGPVSGISRFVIGLCGGLARALTRTSPPLSCRVLLVAKKEPPLWAVELVQRYPGLVSFWSGGPGSLSRKKDKPIWLWPSSILNLIAQKTAGRFFWIAPANFDRPLLFGFSRGKWRHRLIQIVHDTIPLSHRKSVGFLFRLQFRVLVKRSLSRFPFVFAISHHTAEQLRQWFPKREWDIPVIGNGVDALFGRGPKYPRPVLFEKRKEFLLGLLGEIQKGNNPVWLDEIVHAQWVLGVGRWERYKNWELGEQAVQKVRSESSESIWWVRTGTDGKEFGKTGLEETGGLGVSTERKILQIARLNDEDMSRLYSLADITCHPSCAEGFGLPPVESIFCGTPVLYRSGTAVEAHFEQATLPNGMAKKVTTSEPEDWAKALGEVLRELQSEKSGLHNQMRLAQSQGARASLISNFPSEAFDWENVALRLLQSLSAKGPR